MSRCHLDYFVFLIFTWISPKCNQAADTKFCKLVEGYSIQTLKAVTVQRGLCVNIPCSFTVPSSIKLDKNSRGFWFPHADINQPPVAANNGSVSTNTVGRFLLSGEVWRGECSLSINDAVAADSDFYLFRLIFPADRYSYCNITPTVTVTELTDKPEISPQKTLKAGEEVTLTCTSPGRCNGSAPLITWSGVQGKNVTNLINYADGNKIYYSNITFTPSRLDNNSPLNCIVNFKKSNATTSQQIILNVEYPPYITITAGGIYPSGNITTENTSITVLEESSLTMNCTVDSNPEANISWYGKDMLLDGQMNVDFLTYELRNITLNDTGRYRCSAQNKQGIRNRTLEITVQYAPRVPKIVCAAITDCSLHDNYMVYAPQGSSLSLACSAEGSPPVTLIWIKSNAVIGGGLSYVEMTLVNVSIGDEGRYTCLANNIYGISETSIEIKMTYKPRTIPLMKSCCHKQSNTIECKCIVMAFPEASTQWRVGEDSYPSSYDNNALHITTDIHDVVCISTMVMNVTPGDIPRIECRSSNQQGELVLLLHDTEQTTSIPSSIITIIVVCVLVVIAVLLVKGILLSQYYRRRRATKSKMECSYYNTEVFTTGLYKSQERPIEDRAQAEEEDFVEYATVIFPPQKTKAIKDVKTEYACIKLSSTAATGTSLPITK